MHCIKSFQENIITTHKPTFHFDINGGMGSIYYRQMKQYSKNIAQVEVVTENFDTYEFLLQKCVRTALELKRRDVQKGDHISLCTDHHLNACVPLIAAYFIGAVPVPLEPTMVVPDLMYFLNQIHPKVIFTIQSAKDKIVTSAKNLGITPEIITFEDEFKRDFLKPQNGEKEFVPYYAQDLKETATIYFSSGSTGLPKGICINHYGMTNYYTSTMQKADDNHVVYSPSNWYWVSSGISMFSTTVFGGTRVLGSFNANDFWTWIDKYKIVKFTLAGFAFMNFCKSKRPQNIDVSSVKTIRTGSVRSPTEYLLEMKRLFPNANIFQVYGMTEGGVFTQYDTNNKFHEKMAREKIQSVGMPVQGCSYKVVDTETEETVGPNTPGELRIKTNKIMNGYYNLDSSDQFDKDGWFKTADIVYYDEDFCFYFVNRIKDVLKSKGWSVYPVKLEQILGTHPAVKVGVVIGKPHKTEAEHATAVVILNEGFETKITPEELETYVNDRVVDCRERIRGGVYIMKEMPLTVTGKINKNRVKQIILDGDQAVY